MSGRRQRSVAPLLGAVDLGSNSFHMVVAQFSHGQLVVMDRLRETVRLAAGIGRDNRLDAASQRRALACMARFGERLRHLPPGSVRVVGTNALRSARSIDGFRERACRALGHPLEVISGIEEARLIYLGVSHSLPRIKGAQLVVDIGGGSTEIIVGRGLRPRLMESLYIGCVGLTASAFPDGRLTARAFRKARQAARLELEPVRSRFLKSAFERVVGASGTIRAAHDVLRNLGRAVDGITVKDLEFLIRRMIAAGHVARLDLPGVSTDRAEILPAGVAILVEVLAGLGGRRMTPADGALREGILYDMVGRLTHSDARVRSVNALQRRFHVDTRQAGRVGETAVGLWRQVADDWEIGRESDRDVLAWAAALHEVGLDIAHAHHHRHGAYLLENADIPGFTRDEQRVLAALVRNHRRKPAPEVFGTLQPEWRVRALRLAVLLRMAVLLNRSRAAVRGPAASLKASRRNVRLSLAGKWLERNPLTAADLEQECLHLQAAGIAMRVVRRRC